ncbi:N-acetylglucosaminidase [Bacillus sp. T3]|uniref:N-acetylglucosaminidase n=1 Tax=Bacillus sp. T3 TaxID=467262 RepID=UPI002980C619|nr:N-acetylglucosaminidase [Bacillus sp. T3]
MNLTKLSGVSAETLNIYLKGKGILENQGQAFIDAGKKYGINEVYLMAHTLLETGNGTSTLAKGIEYNGKIVYNMYGIGAIDSNPIGNGAKTAYEKGWFTPYDAIVGGAAFIDNSYLSGNNYTNTVQNTLYEMRWNPEFMATKGTASHQYASDIGWAYKQVNTMYEVYKIQPFTIYLEIPKFK